MKDATVMKFNELISWEYFKFLHFFWDHYVIFKTIYSVCVSVINVQILFSTTNWITMLPIYARLGGRWN